jgi:hypothetical protein
MGINPMNILAISLPSPSLQLFMRAERADPPHQNDSSGEESDAPSAQLLSTQP